MMVTRMDAKTEQMSVRISGRGKQVIEEIMNETGAKKSLVLRAMLAVAISHKPAVIARIQGQV